MKIKLLALSLLLVTVKLHALYPEVAFYFSQPLRISFSEQKTTSSVGVRASSQLLKQRLGKFDAATQDFFERCDFIGRVDRKRADGMAVARDVVLVHSALMIARNLANAHAVDSFVMMVIEVNAIRSNEIENVTALALFDDLVFKARKICPTQELSEFDSRCGVLRENLFGNIVDFGMEIFKDEPAMIGALTGACQGVNL